MSYNKKEINSKAIAKPSAPAKPDPYKEDKVSNQWLDNYKHGGSTTKKLRVQHLPASNQNIQSNVNELQMQNKDLYGPVAKRRYLPTTKENRSWLDKY